MIRKSIILCSVFVYAFSNVAFSAPVANAPTFRIPVDKTHKSGSYHGQLTNYDDGTIASLEAQAEANRMAEKQQIQAAEASASSSSDDLLDTVGVGILTTAMGVAAINASSSGKKTTVSSGSTSSKHYYNGRLLSAEEEASGSWKPNYNGTAYKQLKNAASDSQNAVNGLK